MAEPVTNGTPSPVTPSTGQITVPSALPWQRALALCARLRTGKNFSGPAFKAQLERIFADGKMTKEEFAELLGLNETGGVTNEFWKLFTGRSENPQITGVDDFVDALENCEESLNITGHSLVTISHSRNIVPVSRETLGRMVRDMNLSVADLANNPYLNDLLRRAKALGGDSDKTGFDNLSQKTWELLAFGLFTRFTEAVWKDLGYDDINKLNLSDPWVAERFRSIFENYVKTASLPTKDQLNSLLRFQDRVTEFRAWARERTIANRVNVSGVRPEVIDEVLANYKEKGPEWVVQQLNNPANRVRVSAPEVGQNSGNPEGRPSVGGSYSYFPPAWLRISPQP